MNRRTFLGTLAGGLLAAPFVAQGQQAGKIPRIGVLVPVEPESPTEPHIGGFRQGLKDLGYVEGRNITVEYRYALGRSQLYAGLVSQLLHLNVDVIVVGSVAPTLAAKQVTQSIPIVGVGMGADPVRIGIVPSLARPGGNITGSTWATGGTVVAKYVQLLKEAAPRIHMVGYLRDADTPPNATFFWDARAAGQAMGLEVRALDVSNLNEVEKALADMCKERGGSLIVRGGLFTMSIAADVTRLAAKYKLPAIYGVRRSWSRAGLCRTVPISRNSGDVPPSTPTKSLRGPNPAIYQWSNRRSTSSSSTSRPRRPST